MRWPEPCSFQVDVNSGLMTGTSTRYQKHLRDLRGLYADTAAFEALVDARGNDVVYECRAEYRQRRAFEARS